MSMLLSGVRRSVELVGGAELLKEGVELLKDVEGRNDCAWEEGILLGALSVTLFSLSAETLVMRGAPLGNVRFTVLALRM